MNAIVRAAGAKHFGMAVLIQIGLRHVVRIQRDGRGADNRNHWRQFGHRVLRCHVVVRDRGVYVLGDGAGLLRDVRNGCLRKGDGRNRRDQGNHASTCQISVLNRNAGASAGTDTDTDSGSVARRIARNARGGSDGSGTLCVFVASTRAKERENNETDSFQWKFCCSIHTSLIRAQRSGKRHAKVLEERQCNLDERAHVNALLYF